MALIQRFRGDFSWPHTWFSCPGDNSSKRHGVLLFKYKVHLSRTHRVRQGNNLDKTSFTSAARLSVLQSAPKISSNKAKLS